LLIRLFLQVEGVYPNSSSLPAAGRGCARCTRSRPSERRPGIPDLPRLGPRQNRLAAEIVDADALEHPRSSSGITLGRIRWKIRNISAVQRPYAADRYQLFDDGIRVHLLPLPDMHRADSKCAARSMRYSTLRADSPAARAAAVSRASTSVGARRVAGWLISAAKRSHTDCRGLDRDLLADDGNARVSLRRRRGFAGALLRTAGSACAYTRSRLLRVLAGPRPSSGA